MNQILFSYSYLKMLRNSKVSERIFNETQTTGALNFRFKEELQPIDNVEDLAENMQLYSEEMIMSDYKAEFNPDLISSCLQQLQPDNVCILFFAREFADACNKVEPWYKTNYMVEDIPSEWEAQWKESECDPSMFLPESNLFIAKDLSLKKTDSPSIHSSYPTK